MKLVFRVFVFSIFALWIRVTDAEGITWIGCPKEMEVGKWYQIKAIYTDQYGNKSDVSIVLGANYETLAEWDTKLNRCRITKILKNCGYTTLFWTAATYYSGVAKSGKFRIPVKAGPVAPEIWDADIRGPDEIHPHTTNAYSVIAFNKEGKSLSGLEITYSLSSNDVCWLQNDRYIVVGDVEKKVYLDFHVNIFLNGQLFPGNKRIVVRAEDYCLNPVITSKAVASERIEEEVSIKCQTEEARIYCTLDGSDPSSTNGFLYDAPFRMEEAAMVKAVAYADNKDSSDIVVASVIGFAEVKVVLSVMMGM